MNNKQWNCFADYLHGTFLRSGFEVVDKPYVDYALQGFRATYLRRYLLQQPTSCHNGILNTLVSVAGLPFGYQDQKMVILASPRDLDNVPIADTLRLRIHIDEEGSPSVVHGDQPQPTKSASSSSNMDYNSNIQLFNQQHEPVVDSNNLLRDLQFFKDLSGFVAHLLEIISPGLIDLPTEMKLEILKKLNIDSIIRMSQVNSEFRELIFRRGEYLWRHLCYRDYKLKKINRMLHRSWLELYKEFYIKEQIEICRKERALPGLPERPALPPPGPALLQIEWLPEVLELPFYPMHGDHPSDNNNHLPPFAALEYNARRRANSLDGMDI